MSAVTITCPACGRSSTLENSQVCPHCNANVGVQVVEAHLAALRQITARMNAPRPRSGGGTVNGWGTTLLGYQARGDGTWDATKWFTVAAIPLVPLRALHVRPVSREHNGARERLLYDVLDEGRPEPRRVLRTLATLVLAAGPGLTYFFWTGMREALFGKRALAFFVGLGLLAWFGAVMLRIHNSDKAFKAATPGTAPAADPRTTGSASA